MAHDEGMAWICNRMAAAEISWRASAIVGTENCSSHLANSFGDVAEVAANCRIQFTPGISRVERRPARRRDSQYDALSWLAGRRVRSLSALQAREHRTNHRNRRP